MVKLLLFFSICSFAFSQNEFSSGPYGNGYFETAGPFIINDLNATSSGDINSDNSVNVQDVIVLIGYILGNLNFTDQQQNLADVNNDNAINVQDIVIIVNNILYPQDQGIWNFEWNWSGEDIYIFLHQHSAVPGSIAMWNSNTKAQLLENSPDNVHYFFVSSENNYITQINQIKEEFDLVLQDLSESEQLHWKSHLHFIPDKGIDLENWLSNTLIGNYAFSIDGMQKIREVGYLGNPATFTGTYLSYIAHEAVYLNYELNTFSPIEEEYEEIIIFDEEIYTGGWAATTTKIVDLPSDDIIQQYDKLEVDLLRGCPDSNGGYSDAGCDEYDRIARLFICNEDGSDCIEITRWITPFGRQPHHLTDVSPFISMLRPGGSKMFKFQESGWPNSLLTLKLRLYNNSEIESPKDYSPMWSGTVGFNPNYGENRPPLDFNVPNNVIKVEFVAYITGHGWGSAGCFNCAEFCNSKHIFSINGGIHEFETSFPNAASNNYCMSLEAISEGVIPNQGGTWGYGRAGWCPGQDVKPYIVDITDYVEIGNDNIIEYDACRVVGNSCVTPPVCNGDGYCPEIAFSSHIIFYY